MCFSRVRVRPATVIQISLQLRSLSNGKGNKRSKIPIAKHTCQRFKKNLWCYYQFTEVRPATVIQIWLVRSGSSLNSVTDINNRNSIYNETERQWFVYTNEEKKQDEKYFLWSEMMIMNEMYSNEIQSQRWMD